MAYANFSQNDTKTNVQFYSGPQANLTTYITTGGAIEGAFYLTTDTHRLYVGRKVEGTSTVKAVQVSKGVTFVATSGDLPAATSTDFEEGELYYVTTTNVLAALREKLNDGVSYNPKQYEWVQINPPTGITSVEGNSVRPSGNTTDVIINTKIATDGGDKTGKTKFVAGDNVTLTPGLLNASGQVVADSSNTTVDGIKTAVMTITATDTKYKAGVEDSTLIGGATTHTAGVIGLLSSTTSTFGTTLDATKIILEGKNTVAVTSSATANTVTIAGPTISAVTVGNHATDGFNIGITATDGDDNNLAISAARLTPYIHYGNVSGTYAATAVFASGIASLDVYTTAQTRSEIDNAIKEKLATADAMTYCGTIAPDEANNKTLLDVLKEKIIANGGAHNGDVYKIAGIDSSISDIDGVVPDAGDLLVITGTEETSGTFAGQILVGNTGVSGTPGSYTATNAYTANGLIALCELVPSGDEPEVQAAVSPSNANSTPSSFQLKDGKNGASTNILTTTFQGVVPSGVSGSSKILVTSTEETVSSGKKLNVQIAHATTARNDATNGDKSNVALTASTATDSIGADKYKFFMLSGYDGLKTDAYGHVTGLQGTEITFEHNKVTKLEASYGTGAASGLIKIDRNDTIGSTLADADKASIKLVSNSLYLEGDNTNKQLNINLVWNTF